jgi:CBS domain-containing protein
MTTKTVCCLPNDTVVKAAQLMKRENVGAIPVIENKQTQKYHNRS